MGRGNLDGLWADAEALSNLVQAMERPIGFLALFIMMRAITRCTSATQMEMWSAGRQAGGQSLAILEIIPTIDY
jgi:hypothetical protein